MHVCTYTHVHKQCGQVYTGTEMQGQGKDFPQCKSLTTQSSICCWCWVIFPVNGLFVDLGFYAILQSSETLRYDTVQSSIGMMTFSFILHHFSLTHQMQSTVDGHKQDTWRPCWRLKQWKVTYGAMFECYWLLNLTAIGTGLELYSPQRVWGQSYPQRGGPWLWGIWPG